MEKAHQMSDETQLYIFFALAALISLASPLLPFWFVY